MKDDQHTKHLGPENDSAGLKALVAVAAGLGVIGFVTLIGGAIMHVQLAAVGIPADQAVSALPQSTLLVVGVRQLVGFFAAVVLVLAMLWLLESKGVSPGRVRWVGVVLLAVVGVAVIELDLVNAQGALLYEALAIVLVPLLGVLIWFAGIKGMPRFSIFATVTAIAAALLVSGWRYTLSRLSPVVRPVVVVRTTGSPVVGILRRRARVKSRWARFASSLRAQTAEADGQELFWSFREMTSGPCWWERVVCYLTPLRVNAAW